MGEQNLKEKAAKGIFWGGVSNGISQILGLVFGIFLARLLTPADYGMVGMLSIFTLIAGALQESGFVAALANKKVVRHEDYNAVFWFSLSTGIVLYVILFFCSPLIARYFGIPELVPLARYVFLCFLLSSLGTAHSAYLFRNLMVKQKAIITAFTQLGAGIVGVTMAYCGMSYWGIASQAVANVLLATLGNWYFSSWRPTFTFNFSPLRDMFRFSCKLLVTNVFNHLNNNLFSFILGSYYSPSDVGYYNQANKWNTMGHSFVSGMIQGVAQPVLANVRDEKERQRRVFRKMLRFTAFVSFPVMLGLSLVAQELIVITLTDKWLRSAVLLQVLCAWGAFAPIAVLYSNLLISRGKSNVYMWNFVALGILQVVAMFSLYPYGIGTMVRVYVAINILWLLVWQYFVWREIGLSLWDSLKDILPFLCITAGVMWLTRYAAGFVPGMYGRFALKILMAATLYILIMKCSGAVTYKESVRYLLKRK